MASLPSYQEAIRGPDWLELVAPHITVRDYARLCRVSSRFYSQFAPRLWNDPLTAARLLGLHPGHDVQWYFRFVMKHAKAVRVATRSLVRALDFRGFASADAAFLIDSSEGVITSSLRYLPELFPELKCILLDGHPEVDPGGMGRTVVSDASKLAAAGPLVLSIPHCRTQLPAAFFTSPYLNNLVYLDVSSIPGSLNSSLTQGHLSPTYLPNLRIFKAQEREIDDSTAILLARAFNDRLWSLDLGRNRLTDLVIDRLISYAFPSYNLRSDSHFEVEGKVAIKLAMGTASFGPFSFVLESSWSGSFNHPQRYLMDAPMYIEPHAFGLQEDQFPRADGRSEIKQDTVSMAKNLLAGQAGTLAPNSHDAQFLDMCRGYGGVTHLCLNGNRLTARGVERLIRVSGGQLERLDCGSMSFSIPKSSLRKWTVAEGASLLGTAGAAHLFRPIFSPNLQSLRIHHSLVTRVLHLELPDLLTMENIWASETSLLEMVQVAYPHAFVPDMNPRLRSLTLTSIPRYSNGPIIDKLIEFLHLASVQERAIQEVRVASRRSPSLLPGLRHIRLEFEHDPSQELGDSDEEELDPEELMRLAAEEFSFFGGNGWGSTSPSERPRPPSEHVPRPQPPQPATHAQESDRLEHFPYTETNLNYLEKLRNWNGKVFSVPVWIGPGIRGPNRAVNAYMSLLRDPSLHETVAPVSPCHVAAGVPAGSYIFLDAWDAMLAYNELKKPSRSDLRGMRDVVAAIKDYRQQTKTAYAAIQSAAARHDVPLGEPHFHWTGRLEVSLANTMEHYHSSKHWR